MVGADSCSINILDRVSALVFIWPHLYTPMYTAMAVERLHFVSWLLQPFQPLQWLMFDFNDKVHNWCITATGDSIISIIVALHRNYNLYYNIKYYCHYNNHTTTNMPTQTTPFCRFLSVVYPSYNMDNSKGKLIPLKGMGHKNFQPFDHHCEGAKVVV